MKISELIHTLAEPIATVMKRYGKGNINVNFPSRAMAYAIYLYNKKTTIDQDITDKNNPFGLIDPSTGQFIEFNSLEEAIISFKESTSEDPTFEEKYPNIAKANNLYRFDKEALYAESGNIIDTPDVTPSVDQYTVKSGSGNEITRTSDLEEAEKMAQLNAGSKVYNSRGVVINAKQKAESDNIVKIDLRAGSKVICNNVNLYYNLTDKRPGRSINGEFYLYDGKKVRDRYSICIKNGSEEKPVYTMIGYINAKDIDV